VALVFAAALLASGCAAAPRRTMAAATADLAQDPPPLDRSLFARTPSGALTEEDLQKILAAPLELALPARVGVIPVVAADDWRGPSPDDNVPAALAPFAEALGGDAHFTLVSQLLPIPSGALGMEALRELAARYRLRYVILYREVIHHTVRSNGWAWGYATLLGALFLPGETLAVHGYVEASLFDVKTGLLLYTVRRPVSAMRDSNLWHTDDKLAALDRKIALTAAPGLAAEVRHATEDLGRAAALERAPAAPPLAAPPQTITRD
jgi:hypothetical protein